MIRAAFPISPPPSLAAEVARPPELHERVYGVLLFLLAGSAAFVIGTLLHLMTNGSVGKFPAWSLGCLIAMCGGYLCAIVTTLYLRRFRPLAGARATAMLNGALLVVVPAGTIVGAYGLWKLAGSGGIAPRRGVETSHDLSSMLLHDRAADRTARRGREFDHVSITTARAN
jgi:hypothetical protein